MSKVKFGIRSKIILLFIIILSISMFSFLFIAQNSMKYQAKNSKKSIEKLKDEAEIESEKGLQEQAEIYLQRFVNSQADNSNYIFSLIESQINIAHDFLVDIWGNNSARTTNNTKYLLDKTTENPELKFYYFLAPKTKTDNALKNEIDQLAGLEILFRSIVKNNKEMKLMPMAIDGVYLGTQSGIFYNMTWLAYYDKNYDPRKRPWYQSAKGKENPIWSDIYIDKASNDYTITCSRSCYVDDKLKGVIGIDVNLNAMMDIVTSQVKGIGEVFLVNEYGEILTYSKLSEELQNFIGNTSDIKKSKFKNIRELNKKTLMDEEGIYELENMNQSKLFAFSTIKRTKWKIVFAAPTDYILRYVENTKTKIDKTGNEILEFSEKSFERTLYKIIIIFFFIILLAILLLLKFSALITKPLCFLSEKVEEIGNGELDTKLDIKKGDEIGVLAENINRMTNDLKKYIKNLKETTAVKERMESELQIANKIQASMLPRIFPPFPERTEFDIYGTMDPAKDVGGDFFDFYLIDKSKFCFTIADVSGKGIPAALFMVISKTILKNATQNKDIDLEEAFFRANNSICKDNDEYLFVTTMSNCIDLTTGEVEFVNAGHNPPLLYSKKRGSFEYLEMNKGFVMGGMSGFQFKKEKYKMEKGDIIFLYTDGVTEAMDTENNQYSEERLLKILNELTTDNIVEIEKKVKEDMMRFTKGAEQFDDITILIFKYNG